MLKLYAGRQACWWSSTCDGKWHLLCWKFYWIIELFFVNSRFWGECQQSSEDRVKVSDCSQLVLMMTCMMGDVKHSILSAHVKGWLIAIVCSWQILPVLSRNYEVGRYSVRKFFIWQWRIDHLIEKFKTKKAMKSSWFIRYHNAYQPLNDIKDFWLKNLIWCSWFQVHHVKKIIPADSGLTF